MAAKSHGKPGIVEADENYFGTVKTFKRKLKACKTCTEQEDITYLWVCVTADGLKKGFCGKKSGDSPLAMYQWLNIIDEAASLGANWLVLSLADPLEECESIWPISKWAQQVHGMTVGLHLKECASLTGKETKLIRQLDLDKTRVLLRCTSKKVPEKIEKQGITVWTANPQPDGEKPKCLGPKRMIFVNENGVLYTCGLVEGNDTYRIGHVEDGRLKHILNDPEAPRKVCDDIHVVTPGCDGCPALLAGFFQEM